MRINSIVWMILFIRLRFKYFNLNNRWLFYFIQCECSMDTKWYVPYIHAKHASWVNLKLNVDSHANTEQVVFQTLIAIYLKHLANINRMSEVSKTEIRCAFNWKVYNESDGVWWIVLFPHFRSIFRIWCVNKHNHLVKKGLRINVKWCA